MTEQDGMGYRVSHEDLTAHNEQAGQHRLWDKTGIECGGGELVRLTTGNLPGGMAHMTPSLCGTD